jgi:hypothetical protein
MILRVLRKYTIVVAMFLWVSVFVSADASDVAISEVFFDPSGSDTGLEYIVVQNFGSDDVDMTGWDLYPSGAGYFTFPAFTLSAGDSVKINLRVEGVDTATELFHTTATSNMGNSSGSVALFSSGTHSADTIISYVRYHKVGSGEKKTWESSAVSSAIWTAGDFVEVTEIAEGSLLKLLDINNKFNSSGWGFVESDLQTSGDVEEDENQSSSEQNNSSTNNSAGLWYENEETKIRVYGGKDKTVLIGAMVDFEALVESGGGEPIDGARVLWNFGDGTTAEGQKVTHTFLYPGVYTISTDVAFGQYSALDRLIVTALETPIVVSEIKPSFGDEGGFVEIFNNSSRTIDISRFGVAFGEQSFFFPQNSFVSPRSYVIITDDVVGFSIPEAGQLSIFYPNRKIFFTSFFASGILSSNESLSVNESGWYKAKTTPGEQNIKEVNVPKQISNNSKKITKISETNEIKKEPIVPKVEKFIGSSNSAMVDSVGNNRSSIWWLIFGSVGGMVIAGISVFIFRQIKNSVTNI